MSTMLNNLHIAFPNRYEKLYKLKEFLEITNSNCHNHYQLPIIVNITSLNSYGISIKNLLSKTNALLLLNICQLDSILAEYYHSPNGHQHIHRTILGLMPKKPTKIASGTLRSMRKLSKSLVSLAPGNQAPFIAEDELTDGEKDTPYNERTIIKNLNDRRSSTNSFCRIPLGYEYFFELLNENNKPILACNLLSELLIIKTDPNDSEKRIEKWPPAFLLRSSCKAYTKKNPSEVLNPRLYTQNSHSKSNYESIPDFIQDDESSKVLIELNDDVENLPAGQILTILNDCYAYRMRLSDKESKEEQPPSSPSSFLSTASWVREKSKSFFTRKRKSTASVTELSSSENTTSKIIYKKSEPYLKCRTQQGKIVYIFLHESGIFSPIHYQTKESEFNTESNLVDISGVLKLKEIMSNFRFPVSVHLIKDTDAIANTNAIATANHDELSKAFETKLRLLMHYSENVIFAHPLNLQPQKSSKTPSTFVIIPISVDADIEIQPCMNMSEISQTDVFQNLIETCFQKIQQYQSEISLINVPIKITKNKQQQQQQQQQHQQQKVVLQKKRSQSASNFEDTSADPFRSSNEHFDTSHRYSDTSLSFKSATRLQFGSAEELESKSPNIETRNSSKLKLTEYYEKTNQNNHLRFSQVALAQEDEIYEEVDKIYDYIRTGCITNDVKKIQEKELSKNGIPIIVTPKNSKKHEQEISPENIIPGQTVADKFSPKVAATKTLSIGFEVYLSAEKEKNVDDDEAHALFLASKRASKINFDESPHSKLKSDHQKYS